MVRALLWTAALFLTVAAVVSTGDVSSNDLSAGKVSEATELESGLWYGVDLDNTASLPDQTDDNDEDESFPDGSEDIFDEDSSLLAEEDQGSPTGVQQDPGLLENIAQTLGNPCPPNWERFNDQCYLASGEIQTWSQAHAYCRSQGGDLVKITSQEENDFVLELVREKASSLQQVWIGLHWDPASNDFYWADNSVPAYKNWAPNEPNGRASEPCGMMWTAHTPVGLPIRASGYWNDLPCGIVPGLHCGSVCKKLPA